VYGKDVEAELERLRTAHLNDDAETEVEKADLVDGIVHPRFKACFHFCTVLWPVLAVYLHTVNV